MILSYHPYFEADKNLICAGRKPDVKDLVAIKAADAVILAQGCSESLYEMARKNCLDVFPNYDARFRYPGKTGQVQLFKKTQALHPKSEIYLSTGSFISKYGVLPKNLPFGFPFVFKFDWGGEGDTVYLIKSFSQLNDILQKAGEFEKSGYKGFIIQKYIPSKNRSLRVVTIGRQFISYWRIQQNVERFSSSLAKGAAIDSDSDEDFQEKAISTVKDFCALTGINLAGFDLLFSEKNETKEPLFLEINYFFGRRGLGGSEKYYSILVKEINKWIDSIGLS